MTVASFAAVAGDVAAFSTFVLWLCFVLGACGRRSWIGDALSNFRVQYAGLFLLCALTLLFARRPLPSIVALLGTAATAWPVITYAFGRAASPSQSSSLRVGTFNVWFRNRDLRPAAHYFERSGADVILAQELTAASALEFGKLLPSYPHVLAGVDWRRDAAVYSRLPIVSGELVTLVPDGARAAVVTLSVGNRIVHVVSVHVHWPMGAHNAAMRSDELASLAALAKTLDGPLIVGGDFNLTPWSPHYAHFLEASGLHDCARGHGLLPTWPSQWRLPRIRIDHFFASRHCAAVAAKTGPHLGSDHLPTIADFALRE